MLRGPLDDGTKATITAELPDLTDLVKAAPSLGSDWNFRRFAREPEVPIAGICLRDAISTLSASRFAVYEALAHKLWYEQHAAQFEHPELQSLWCQRFFADDAALRLYGVGEDLAEAIFFMLKIKKEDLQPYKERYSSRQTIIGNYLREELPNHPLTRAAAQLAVSKEWKWTRDYRDKWVHQQPPLIDGFGIQFTRTSRWRTIEDAPTPQKVMNIGAGGDQPEYTVDQLLTNVSGALSAVVETTRIIAEHLVQIINDKQAEDKGTWVAPKIKS